MLLRRFFLSLVAAVGLGCSSSPLSETTVTDPAQLKITVSLFRRQHPDGTMQREISAFLRDKDDRQVTNQTIRVLVNGKPLDWYAGSTNYNHAFPMYRLLNDDVPEPGDEMYTFSVVLSDGHEYNVGSIQTPPAFTPERFQPPLRHSRRQELVLRWQGLTPHGQLSNWWKISRDEGTRAELQVSKLHESRASGGTLVADAGSAETADYIQEKVRPGGGSLTVPLAFFQGPLAEFNALEVMFQTIETVKVKTPFLPGSVLTYQQEVLNRVDVTD